MKCKQYGRENDYGKRKQKSASYKITAIMAHSETKPNTYYLLAHCQHEQTNNTPKKNGQRNRFTQPLCAVNDDFCCKFVIYPAHFSFHCY